MMERIFRRPLAYGALAAFLVFAWQAATVQINYAGNWTGLFRIGRDMPLPPRLATTAFRSAHSVGFDGQFYLVLAYDPFTPSIHSPYLDAPEYSSRRILVPILSWLLAAGQARLIPLTYVAVMLISVFAGVYFLSRLLVARGRSPAYGLLFLLVPSTLTAIDSMTVDGVLATLTACLLWQLSTGNFRAIWFTLAAAALVRETGLFLAAAAVFSAVRARDWKNAPFFASAAIPAFLWFAYLASTFPPASANQASLPLWLLPKLQSGILLRLFEPLGYPHLTSTLRLVVRLLDALALSAMGTAIVFAAIRFRHQMPGLPRTALGLQILLAVAITDKWFWDSAYSYGRLFGPLFVILFAEEAALTGLLFCVTLACLIDLRILAEYLSQILGFWRALAHW